MYKNFILFYNLINTSHHSVVLKTAITNSTFIQLKKEKIILECIGVSLNYNDNELQVKYAKKNS